MSLSPGQTLAAYEILALLGKGGMGEVYRARDPNLDREVAIKVLPEIVAQDPERVLRFEREARVLASLTHAHIGAIHGFESVDAMRFLILEFVEGESLAQRLSRGPMPIEEALDTCRQIAEALEAAHEKGVVHRDLKPANVQLKADGTVKVLDFGLARAMAADESSGTSITDSPTITADFTRPGVVLGTAPYMSPEQARGKAVDKRADIWAFGCCLYEALTGKQTFQGETVTDLFADIIKGEPDWKALPSETPWKVRELLERCLTKDPNQRLRDIGDARIELRRLSTDTGSLTAAAEVTAAPRRRRPMQKAASAVGMLLAGAVLALGIRALLRSPETRPLRQLAIDLPEDVPTTVLASPRMSADGSRLLLMAGEELASVSWFLQDLTTRLTRPVPVLPTGGGDQPFLSPDSSMVGFHSEGMLKQARLDGGPAQNLVPVPSGTDILNTGFHGGEWVEDGTIVFIAGEPRTLYSFRPGETELQELYTAEDASQGMAIPRMLPGGRGVLLTLGSFFGSEVQAVGLLDLQTSQFTRLIEGATTPLYVRTGHLLYVQDNALFASRFDPQTLALDPGRVPVPIDSVFVGLFGRAHYAVSHEEGALVFRPGTVVGFGELLGTSRFRWLGDENSLLPGMPPALDFALSPDGRLLAISTPITGASLATPLPPTEILLFDLANPTAPSTRLTRGVFQYSLSFSPDSQQLAYNSMTDGLFKLFVIPVEDRNPDPEPLLEGVQFAVSWTADSKSLLLGNELATVLPTDVFQLTLEDGELRPVLESSAAEGFPALSPNGDWLAFQANLDGQATGDLDVYVQRYPPSGRAMRITTGGAQRPQWDPREDRLRLYYVVGGNPDAAGAGGSLHGVTITESQGEITWETEDLLPEVQAYRLEKVASDGRILVMESFNDAGGAGAQDRNRFIHVANFLDWLERQDSGR